MPTIPQLPSASAAGSSDELPVSQSGITRSVTVSEVLAGTQPIITLPSQSLLGRVSLGPGGPEAVNVGVGLEILGAVLAADGGDHAGFPQQTTLTLTDTTILSSGGTPMQMPLPVLRGLFAAGTNVTIDGSGNISASTDPSVTTELTAVQQGLTTTEANLTALAARIPTGGYVTLNSQGQVTAPIAGPVSLGTVSVETGGPSRTLLSKAFDTLNILDFGAVVGGADCTAAFNAAYTALPGTGGEIFMPAGEYWISSPLIFTGKAVAIRGAGRGLTRLHFSHTGIGFDFVPNNLFAKIILHDFSAYAENTAAATAAVARITYPPITSFGYVSASIWEVECFSYPNPVNTVVPFPQTFVRGFILNNCWSTQVSSVSWFGAAGAAGTTDSVMIELNRSFDTRISGIQAYYGSAVVLQTGYCEGIYFSNPVVVGADYFFNQTNETEWVGYQPNKPQLLGLWVANGEVNINLGIASLTSVTLGFFIGVDLTRNGGPNIAQSFFSCTNVSNFHFQGCNFVGGPTGGNAQDIAFSFSSSFNSSNNIISDCHFEDMATVVIINGANGTVGLTGHNLHTSNVPPTTAYIDNTPLQNGNFINFVSQASSGVPAGTGSTQDHVFAGTTGAVLLRINNVASAINFVRLQAGATNVAPTVCFDGTDTIVGGQIQTNGGNLVLTAAGAPSGGTLASFLNASGAVNWIEFQNATAGTLAKMATNSGGLSISPNGALWLAPTGGLFAAGLPTSRPAVGSNQLWNNGGMVSIA